MSDYFERVARAMKATHSAGSMNTYETILEALHRKFKTEDELRAAIADIAAKIPPGWGPPGFRFPEDAEGGSR
jgi:hypothetical protein